MMWFRRKVKKGHKIGRELWHPTLNFNVGSFAAYHKPAVYACELKVKGKVYKGALYFGPKLSKPGHVLELSILNFSGSLYGQFVSFQVGRQIRPPMKFASVDALKKQIRKDIITIQNSKFETRVFAHCYRPD